MQDITDNLSFLQNEDNELSVTEYLEGFRFYVDVTENSIDLRQDLKYNKTKYGRGLDLDQLWNGICSVYRTDDLRMRHAPFPKYTMHCIHFDPDMMQDCPSVFSHKGVACVAIEVGGGTILGAHKLKEFCSNTNFPAIEPMFVGESDHLRANIQELRGQSKYTVNGLSGGLVVQNTKPQRDSDGAIEWWYVKPNHDMVLAQDAEPPVKMAKEFVETTLIPDEIIKLEEDTGTNPASSRRDFNKVAMEFLLEQRGADYESYFRRCSYILGTGDPRRKFNILIKKALKEYLDNRILKMSRYSVRTK
jgi:hypothetical protein